MKIFALLINLIWFIVYVYTKKSYKNNVSIVDLSKILKQDSHIFNTGVKSTYEGWITAIEKRKKLNNPISMEEFEEFIKHEYSKKMEEFKNE